jgi:hypothetical protein
MNACRCLVFLFALTIAITCLVVANNKHERGITCELGQPGFCTVDARGEVTTESFGLRRERDLSAGLPMRLDRFWLRDSIRTRLLVPPGKEYCVVFDYDAGALRDTLLPYTLTETAREAIEAAPAWLRVDLENNLRRLSSSTQDRYANLLLGLGDPRIIDEVAFQIAHLSYVILFGGSWDEQLLTINASMMYQIDEELQYVEIVDYGLGTEDSYSTTRYHTIVEGETTLVEIPRESYYNWVVMPRVSDEYPIMDENVYGYFWREYLYYHHDYGYPLLQEVMGPITVLWDGERHDWSGGRAFTDSMLAVDGVGNWCSETVPSAAEGNRPIQPNVIAHEHNGNCGELQDLLCAAARTCLIPTICTMWLDGWHPYQIDLGRGPTHIDNHGIAYDHDYGGGKDVSCIWDWRNDGFTWDVVERYSQVCSLTVYIEDPNGIPVDNASVRIASEAYYPPYSLYDGTWGETGQDGQIQFILGDNQNYYVKVETSLGDYPSSGYALIISSSVAGEHYYWQWTTPDEMPQLDITDGGSGIAPVWVIEVEYDLPYDLLFGRDRYAGPPGYYSEPIPEGQLSFFIVDRSGFLSYRNGDPFAGYEVAEDASSNQVHFHVLSPEDHLVVLSGGEHHGLTTCADVVVRLWERFTANVDEVDLAESARPPAPNPFNTCTSLEFQLMREGDAIVDIYDVSGRLVRTITEKHLNMGTHRIVWDGTDHSGSRLPSGRYFFRLGWEGSEEVREVLLVR